MNNKIPPLPRNAALEKACGFEALHYKEALAYGQACWEAALEEAAKACEGEQWVKSSSKTVGYMYAFNEGCESCEDVIRRLK